MQQHTGNSLISEHISKFFVNFNKYSIEESRKYLFSNWCLNFKELYGLFGADLEHSGAGRNYEAYLSCFNKLLPIFEGIHHCYDRAKLILNDLQLEWLGSNCRFLLDLLQSDDVAETLTVERILLLTSLLENALANLFVTNNHKCPPPHLLRDLLSTEELRNIFGTEVISLLKVLMGTPDSINLRNIVWHGFPRPQDIPEYYTSILVLLIHSLGYELKMKKICLTERPKVVEFSKLCRKVSNQLPLYINWFDESTYVQQIENHAWLNKGFKKFWYRLSQYYNTKMYWKLAILITPQIELLLRLLYAQVNDFDVTAKLNEYYITMDSIFECDLPNVQTGIKNNLLNGCEVSEELLNCIYDLFIAPHGPRLRDKISHGEVNISAIDNRELCDILLYMSLGLINFNSPFQKYESVFHLNSLAKEALCDALGQLVQLIKTHLAGKGEDILKDISESNPPIRAKIFNRPRKEPEFMLLLLRNSKLIQTTCINYEHSIEIRLELLAQRELHSKRRRTLQQMITSLPMICNVLCEILNCLLRAYTQLQTDDKIFNSVDALKKLLRFLKHSLKLNENFVKYSDKSSNEWIKALQLCEQFSNMKEEYYPKQHF
ncbi:PREDICTED: endoplasmic reticulum membrane-associated RNA degradation protein isoform X1 [Rhagoletis zephyria]|uniref:endoplasmic reticulum membrane-associated RNA degradation protein isoform X1 n=1 Tax=Rhagoletis zephyria TaxID=28612 RepID=UPI0008113A69|nr:PREDICTED: endoplasmic reticulum membrane-associated RNA degradation protein isoform X1 [Rhagoletis zephyria]